MIKFVEEMKKLMERNDIKVSPALGGTMMQINFPWLASMVYGTNNSVYGYRNVHDMIRMNGSIEIPSLEEMGWTQELEDSDPKLQIVVEVEKKDRTSKAVDHICKTMIVTGKILLVSAAVLFVGKVIADVVAE